PSDPRLARGRRFAPWRHRITVNRAIDWSRAQRARQEVTGAEAVLGSAKPVAAADEGIAVRDALEDALAGLAPDQRAAIVLRYLLEYTPGEIARMLDVPRGTVNSRLRRGLDHLSNLLGAGG